MRHNMSGLFDFWKKKEAVPPVSIPVGVDLFGILGVSHNASIDEIRSAYRKLARKFHPDRNPGNPEAAQRFLDISRAHDILTNAELRALYEQASGEAPEAKGKPKKTYYPAVVQPGQERPKDPEKAKRRIPRTGDMSMWEIMFGEPSREQPQERGSIFNVLHPSERREPTGPMPWKKMFPSRVKVSMPSMETLMESLKELPLEQVWDYVRAHRSDPGFEASRTLVVGPIAGSGDDPVEHDIARITGASFDEIAEYVERKGLHRAWAWVLGPLVEQAILGIESLKPSDISGNFFADWDPSGQMLELLYYEARA